MKAVILACDKIRDNTRIGCLKCLKAISEKSGKFEGIEGLEIVAWTSCGGCPGFPIARLKLIREMLNAENRDFDTVFLAGCILMANKNFCPMDLDELENKIRKTFGVEVIRGTHP